MGVIDPKMEIEWIDKRVKDIQKGLLHAENVGIQQAEKLVKDIKDAVEHDKKAMEELRARRIRLAAQLEEEAKVKKKEVL